jgi:hypothetical protein
MPHWKGRKPRGRSTPNRRAVDRRHDDEQRVDLAEAAAAVRDACTDIRPMPGRTPPQQ